MQAHGFFESQMRALNADFADEWDVAQWYQVFNLELEFDIINDEPLFIIDYLSAYARVEVRYDCVYSRGCGMFRSMNAYGDRSKSLPERLNGANARTAMGAIRLERTADDEDGYRRSGGSTDPVDLRRVSGFSTLAGSTGADTFEQDPTTSSDCLAEFGTGYCERLAGGSKGPSDKGVLLPTDDPFFNVFRNYTDFRFAQINILGGGGSGLPTQVLGPWLPKNYVSENAGLADIANPYDDRKATKLGNELLLAAVYNQSFNTFATDGGADPKTSSAAELNLASMMAIDGGTTSTGQVIKPNDRTRASGANPFRPIPVTDNGGVGEGNSTPRGIYYPSAGLQDFLDSGENYGLRGYNLRQAERAWNRGASQQDEKELKEAYLDIELFDSRLWLRVGKQSIVWGKTELFRTTDQFNPQDLGLASLPSLEESRINLWAFRAVYSLYEVGPLEDVRIEGAFNYDQHEGADLGACGEAYAPNPACSIAFGAFAHGQAGVGLAGIDRPDSPWNSIKGWEAGVRLEFRWDRFSFALMDYYGYDDFPTLTRISTYERNVDPNTGRPRGYADRGTCAEGTEKSCLQIGPTSLRGAENTAESLERAATPNNSLLNHHANQQIFAMICSTTVGFSSFDRSACAQTVFGSTALITIFPFSVAQLIGATLSGGRVANDAIRSVVGAPLPSASLSRDIPDSAIPAGQAFAPGYKPLAGGRDLSDLTSATKLETCKGDRDGRGPCGGYIFSPETGTFGNPFAFQVPGLPVARQDGLQGETLAGFLTPEQEALLGCGPFWGTNCDDEGFDLLNAEASSLIQSFGGFEGTTVGYRTDVGIQPGTVGYVGGPVCTFGNLLGDPNQALQTGPDGRVNGDRKLPGCRGPGDAGYDPTVDGRPGQVGIGLNQIQINALEASGTPAGLLRTPTVGGVPGGAPNFGHPLRQWANAKDAEERDVSKALAPQNWQSEMAALSWNFQALLVSQSASFKPNKPFRTGSGKCSFVQPQFCETPQAIFAVTGLLRNDVRAGGDSDGLYGRRTFTWHSGGEGILKWEKRNVVGFSMDFAEDVTKTNWGMEATWIEGLPFGDLNSVSGNSKSDIYNLTVSIDRPTFINFLNANRTFFITTQWFFRWIEDYKQGFTANGPYQVLGILAVNTGYYQDRLLPGFTAVYDVQSTSGAFLPQITYRYNEAFSVTFGAAFFWGRQESAPQAINPLGGGANFIGGDRAYEGSTENGLAVVRDRDELFLRLRYTF